METWILKMIRVRSTRNVVVWALVAVFGIYCCVLVYREIGSVAIIGLLILVGFLATMGRSAWRYMRDPATHPIVARVAQWGDPIEIAAAAEKELQSPRHKGPTWVIADHFLIENTFLTFDILRVQDVLWAYKKVTSIRVNLIPSGTANEAVLVCDGGTATFATSDKKTDEILQFVMQQTPWAIFGFSKEVESQFNKNNRDFRAAIEQRKREYRQQA